MYFMGLSKGLSAIAGSIAEGVLPAGGTLGFIPNAGDPYENPYFVAESRDRLHALGLTTVEMDICRADTVDLLTVLNRVDGLFVAGGNVFYLLHQLKRRGLDTIIAERVRAGLPYFGESAGAVLAYRNIAIAADIDDAGAAPDILNYNGLGLIDFFVLPHVDREKYQELFTEFYEKHHHWNPIARIRDDQAVISTSGSSWAIVDSPLETAGE